MNLTTEEYDLLKQAYKIGGRSPGRESEENLDLFEQQYVKIPSDYRWLLKEFGGCHLLDPEINPLVLLYEDYKDYIEHYVSEPTVGEDFFPCGTVNGDMVGIIRSTDQVGILYHDMILESTAGLEIIATSFKELIMTLAKNRLEIETLISDSLESD